MTSFDIERCVGHKTGGADSEYVRSAIHTINYGIKDGSIAQNKTISHVLSLLRDSLREEGKI